MKKEEGDQIVVSKQSFAWGCAAPIRAKTTTLRERNRKRGKQRARTGLLLALAPLLGAPRLALGGGLLLLAPLDEFFNFFLAQLAPVRQHAVLGHGLEQRGGVLLRARLAPFALVLRERRLNGKGGGAHAC